MMRRYSLSPIRLLLVLAAALCASLGVATAGAQAIVLQDGSGHVFGVALAPPTLPNNFNPQTGSWSWAFNQTGYSPDQAGNGASCADPGLASDFGLTLPANALCLRDTSVADGATVLSSAELFAFTWDANRLSWPQTRGYLEQFLRDLADAGTTSALSNPFASASQYTDALGDRVAVPKVYGGGCIDLGSPGGYTCQFANTTGSGIGNAYPAADNSQNCTAWTSGDVCLTDAAIKHEVSSMISSTGVDTLKARTGKTPLVVMMLPKNVEVCLDHTGSVCSANSGSPNANQAAFCTYHSQVAGVPYVVLPWTVGTSCDAAHMPPLATHPTPPQWEVDYAGARLVGPLSGGISAALVNPFLNGWFGNNGFEIDDTPCIPADHDVDQDPLGGGTYVLQRAFNNAATLQYDPYTYFGCAPTVNLDPTFVVPSAVNPGDTIQFDGSATPSTLLIPKANYKWDFGDGATAIGPSVEHGFDRPGNYNVKLTVTDRGNNTASITETVQVLGAVVPTPSPGGSGSAPGSGGGGSSGSGGLKVHLQLLPQSLKSVLHNGITVRVSSNKAANGIATVWITRASAKKAHIKVGRGAAARIGIGTVASITNGTVTLRLHLSAATAKKLSHLHHVAMTIRLALVSSGSQRVAVVAAGRY